VKHQKPYWNLTRLSILAKSCHTDWLDSNRSVSGPIHYNFKTSKRTFKWEHRQAADKHVIDFFDELDKAAEVDHVRLWYLVNKIRNCTDHTPGSDITFKGVSGKSNETILKDWETYVNE